MVPRRSAPSAGRTRSTSPRSPPHWRQAPRRTPTRAGAGSPASRAGSPTSPSALSPDSSRPQRETIAGLALLGTFAASAASALTDAGSREAGAVTLVVAASGVTVAGVGAAFWGLVAGLVVLAALRVERRRQHSRT
ncbi:benzoate/H(+) symporter BenE family transporter [Terrabacter sp. AAH1]